LKTGRSEVDDFLAERRAAALRENS